MFRRRRTPSARPSLMFRIARPIARISSSFLLYRVPRSGFQKLPLPAAQEVRDTSSGVSPCNARKDDGVLYYQVSSFSPERWTKVVVLQELEVGWLVGF